MRLFFSPCAADKAAICCPSCSFFLPCAEQAVPVVHPAGRSSTWSWRPILCRTYPRMRPGKNVHAVVDFRVTSPGVIWLVACGWAERRHGVGCVLVHSVLCVPRRLGWNSNASFFRECSTAYLWPFFVHRAAATAVMWSLVAPGGALVLVEDGSAKGSHTVRSARQMVLRPSSPSSEPGDVMWHAILKT